LAVCDVTTRAAEAGSLDALIRTQDVIVCVGSGGVGKTTIAAAVAMKAADVGRIACVLTIDPARRLASAMGLEELSGTPTLVSDARFDESGVRRPQGKLFAMMLDTKRTWDDLVHRFASSPDQVRRILANNYYQQISTAIAGSQEFMAMEKLYELHESKAYDLLVLDTPPTRHALDFLNAPQKMIGFMDEGVLKLLTAPSRMAGTFGLGVLTSSTAMMLAVVKRITGFEVLKDISDYVTSFAGMHAGFRERAQRVDDRLRASRTSFALVASPTAETIDEAIFFYRKLQIASMPFGGFIVNRVQESALTTPAALDEWTDLRRTPDPLSPEPDLARRLVENFEAREALAAAHAEHLGLLRQRCPGPHFWRTVPAFDADVHDLAGLARVNDRLFAV
jgi:anion-transporting  ArsA/GET3 family ATPase